MIILFRRIWARIVGRSVTEPDPQPALVAPRPPVRSKADAMRAAVARAGQSTKPTVNPFAIPKSAHPFAPEGVMAMDDSSRLSDYSGWAAAAVGGAITEGQAFLGYPILAEMAQRSEYRRPVETIARHMTREWIELKSTETQDGENDRLQKLDEAIRRFDVQAVIRRWVEHDGFFGRAHLYIDTGATDDPDELKLSIGNGRDDISVNKIGLGDLKALRCVEPVWVYPTNYNSIDPLKGEWYNPETWFVLGKQVHATRLLKLVGREVPDLLKPAYSFGGLPLTQMGKPYVDNWLETRQSVNDIISAFSQFVLKGDVAEALESNAGQDDLFTRADFFNRMRDNRGLMLIDKDSEDFANVSAPLSSLDKLQAQAQEHMATPWAIPLVELFGIQPTGLNASSEGEMKTFEQWIGGAQEALLRSPIETLLGFIQLSEFGEIDSTITFVFRPLRDLSDAEIADKQAKEAQTDCLYVEAGILAEQEVRQRLATDKDSPYQGLDVEDVPAPPAEAAMEGAGGEPAGDDDGND